MFLEVEEIIVILNWFLRVENREFICRFWLLILFNVIDIIVYRSVYGDFFGIIY